MNTNESHDPYHLESPFMLSFRHKHRMPLWFLVLCFIFCVFLLSLACTYSGSVKSTLAFTVPGQQVTDNQRSDQQQQPAGRFAGGL